MSGFRGLAALDRLNQVATDAAPAGVLVLDGPQLKDLPAEYVVIGWSDGDFDAVSAEVFEDDEDGQGLSLGVVERGQIINYAQVTSGNDNDFPALRARMRQIITALEAAVRDDHTLDKTVTLAQLLGRDLLQWQDEDGCHVVVIFTVGYAASH